MSNNIDQLGKTTPFLLSDDKKSLMFIFNAEKLIFKQEMKWLIFEYGIFFAKRNYLKKS
jgi:hypothetical protein